MFDFLRRRKQPVKLFYSTDIHCHLLPGVDHGAPDLETSVDLMRRQSEMGIKRVIATSHVTEGVAENSPGTLLPAGELLRDELQRQGIDIDLHVSAEYRLDELFVKQLKQGLLLPFPNNYLLVENSFQLERMGLDELIFDLQTRGYTLILAHPERYSYYSHDRYRQLHEHGVLFQVNLMSFAGYFSEKSLINAHWMLHEGLIDFLASDMHNHKHAQVIKTYLDTNNYKELAKRLQGRLLNDTAFN